jgi:hypothetical protein
LSLLFTPFDMARRSWHMRVVNEGKKMRQRIADEWACGTNVSIGVWIRSSMIVGNFRPGAIASQPPGE